MTNNENTAIEATCNTLNALGITSYVSHGLYDYCRFAIGPIARVSTYNIITNLQSEASSEESELFKVSEQLDELPIHEWYIPLNKLRLYGDYGKIRYYELAQYILLDYARIQDGINLSSSFDTLAKF